jgi:hypothetical protein
MIWLCCSSTHGERERAKPLEGGRAAAAHVGCYFVVVLGCGLR